MNKKIKELLPPALLIGVTVGLYAPYELYILNADEFWFTLRMFWWIPLLVFFCMTILFVGIGLLLYRICKDRSKGFYPVLLFAAGICLWIQGNFLNVSQGKLNGAEFNWYDIRPQAVRDFVIWIVILVILLFIHHKKPEIVKKAICYVSFLFIGMQIFTLGYLLITLGIQKGFTETDRKYLSYEGLYEIGDQDNVVVFLADMFDDDYFKDILSNYPELTEDLDGFTYFNNYTGLYPATAYTVTSMFTGKVFLNQTEKSDWIEEQEKGRLWEDELLEDGYRISLYTTVENVIPKRVVEAADNNSRKKLKITDKTGFTIQLYRLVGCKYLPNLMKRYIWMNGDEFNTFGDIFHDDNKGFRDGLRNNGISVVKDEKQFKYIHLDGAHFPYDLDEMGNDVPYNYGDPTINARGMFRIILEYIDGLKRSGEYDNTAIIIMADHGFYHDGVLANPVFLCKPRHENGKLQISNVPASHEYFAATVLDLAEIEDYSDYGRSDLDLKEDDQVERYFYQFMGNEAKQVTGHTNMRLIEYRIPSESNNVWNFTLTNKEYTVDGDVIEHKKYCVTCIEGREWDMSDKNYKPTLIHEPTKDNPSKQYIEYSVYE